MPAGRTPGGRKRRGRGEMKGGNFFSDAGKWLKGAANTVGHEIVDNAKKIRPSSILGLVPHPGAQLTGGVLRLIGLGKKKRRKGGSALGDAIKKAAKKPSKILRLVDHPEAQKVAMGLHLAGYGRTGGSKTGGRKKKRAPSGLHPIAHRGKTHAGMIVQPNGTGFNTMPLSLNGGVMSGSGRGRVR